jgi:hypothetical protein
MNFLCYNIVMDSDIIRTRLSYLFSSKTNSQIITITYPVMLIRDYAYRTQSENLSLRDYTLNQRQFPDPTLAGRGRGTIGGGCRASKVEPDTLPSKEDLRRSTFSVKGCRE